MDEILTNEIQNAFDKATASVKELEELLRKYFNNPMRDFNSSSFRKIQIPINYIRTKRHFLETYSLQNLIDDSNYRDSIAFSLMQTDFNNYIISRIYIWGVTKNLFLKFAIINNASIVEALLICSFKTLRKFCNPNNIVCKYNSNCNYYIQSTSHMKVTKAIQIFFTLISPADKTLEQDFKTIMDIRDKVHLSLISESEYHTDLYSIENYNKSIKVLRFLRDNHIKLVNEFEKQRFNGCKNLPF